MKIRNCLKNYILPPKDYQFFATTKEEMIFYYQDKICFIASNELKTSSDNIDVFKKCIERLEEYNCVIDFKKLLKVTTANNKTELISVIEGRIFDNELRESFDKNKEIL